MEYRAIGVRNRTPNLVGAFRDVIRWKISSNRKSTRYLPAKTSSKVVTAQQAAALIQQGSVVASSGFGAGGRCSIFFWALKENSNSAGTPLDLTWISVSAQGGRGKVSGTIEEIASEKIVSRYISGHLETSKAFLNLAKMNLCELHTLPQGVMTQLIKNQRHGTLSLETSVGLGTFLDPRSGDGSDISKSGKNAYVEEGSTQNLLKYSLPQIDYGLLSAPFADEDGNIYFGNSPTITENKEIAEAAYQNGGKVLVTVGKIIPKQNATPNIESAIVSAIVVNPHHEQIGGVRLKSSWSMFLPNTGDDIDQSLKKVRVLNRTMGFTPKRSHLDKALARMATELFTKHAKPNSLVNIGVGMPEEVGAQLYESGLHKELTFTTEAGVLGGLPLPGIFFGASACPERIESSAWMFDYYKHHLDVSVLGFLQVDSNGNVNVSRRGEDITRYVGPGGFIDIADSAKTIIFVGSWMVGGKMSLTKGSLHIEKVGVPKFVEQVDEITFNGRHALKQGKRVFYVSNVGVFKLAEAGLQLVKVAPGIDIQEDILDKTNAKIILPSSNEADEVSTEVMSGNGFQPSWG